MSVADTRVESAAEITGRKPFFLGSGREAFGDASTDKRLSVPDSVDDNRSRFHEHLVNHTVVADSDAIRVRPREFLRTVWEWIVDEFDNGRHYLWNLLRRQIAQIFLVELRQSISKEAIAL